jgi:CHAT domain-containing protein
MNPKWCLALLPFLAGCERVELRSAAGLYREAEALWRHGAAQKAIEAADKGWRQWRNRPASEWHWKFRLLEAEFLLNEESAAQALALLEAGGGEPPTGELGARYLADLGHAKKDRPLVERAFQIASRERYSSLLPAIELKIAALLRYDNRSDALLHSAVALAHAQSDSYLEASALLDLGFQRLNLSRFDEAIPWLERAISTAKSIGAERVRERALGNLGWCYSSLGDFDRAILSLSEAATLARQIGDEERQLRWLNNIGSVHYRRREYEQAILNYQSAADMARRTNDKYWLPIAWNNLAATSLEIGDLPASERFNEQAVALIRQIPFSRSLIHSQLHIARIEAARKQPQAEASFRAVIDSARGRQPLLLWEAQAGLAHRLRETGRAAEADTEFRNALATIEKEWSKLGEDRHKVTFLAQLITFYGDYVDFLVSRPEIERAAAVADSARARVLAEKLGSEPSGERIGIRPRKPGQILLSYWVAPDRSYLWLIGPKGVSHFTLPGEARITGLVNQYTSVVERAQDPLERDNPAGRALYQALLAPARALIPSGASVIIVPDGPLHGLNFETLIVDDPKPHYWIEDVTVAVAPALSLLQSLPARHGTAAKVLFLGDPAMPDPAYPPLSHLKQEAEIIQKHFPGPASTLLVRQAAHPQAYRAANPGNYNLIHFAAHAVANAESPLNSAVLLSDAGEGYKLYAKDVVAQELQAELVTVSACHSAGAKAYAGEGLLGFTWAFLQAGARNVVAGLWNADDEATAEIMAGFYEKLVSGARPAEALRFAKLQLMQPRSPHRRPYYWGTLQLFTREFADRLR